MDGIVLDPSHMHHVVPDLDTIIYSPKCLALTYKQNEIEKIYIYIAGLIIDQEPFLFFS